MSAPKAIGRYDVLDLLGQGGMGRVYLARDTVLGRKVAIKVLRDDLGLPPETRDALISRMRNEARAAATLSHSHVVTLHDMGEEDPVGLFLVFEYVEGPTLRDRIAEGPCLPREIATLARDLGSALDAAHAAGVIHRDVKPENVILAKSGVKVTDFGIARLPDSTITRAGSVLGTPAYSAPEALALGEFSAASDQFSFAATLFEALTARRAFAGDDALSVASRVATEPPAPIGTLLVDVRTRARVELVLQRGLAKDPKKRFGSCGELGEALATALLASGEMLTPAMTSRFSLPPRVRQTQNLVAAAGLITIALLILLGRRPERGHDGEGASLHDVAEAFASAQNLAHPAPPSPASAAKHVHPRESPREAVHEATEPIPVAPHDSGASSVSTLDAAVHLDTPTPENTVTKEARDSAP